MKYPQHLLPQSNYKKIEWNNDLGLCSLIRHTDTKDIFMPGTKTISTEKIKFPSEQFRNDLSINLLSVFKLEDVYIQILNNNFIKDWEPDRKIYPLTIERDFTINRDRGHFALNIQDILSLNTTRPLIEEGLSLEIFHTPTKCNFWHFSIRVYKNNTEISLLSIGDKQKKKQWRTIRNILADLAYFVEEEYSILHRKHYTVR